MTCGLNAPPYSARTTERHGQVDPAVSEQRIQIDVILRFGAKLNDGRFRSRKVVQGSDGKSDIGGKDREPKARKLWDAKKRHLDRVAAP